MADEWIVSSVPDEDDRDEYPEITCPKCGDKTTDMDGFGFVACTVCGECTHPSRTGGICGICGQVEVARDAAAAPGWYVVKGRVMFRCPNGHTVTLRRPMRNVSGTVHQIGPDGAVTPAVACQYDGCGFEAKVKLEGFGG